MKKAVAYMRMSTDKQEHSIDSQWRLIKEYADRNKFSVIHKYEDEGISGRAAEKRPAFMQMIDDSESGDFEAVLIYDSSRFARNLKDAIVYKSILKQNGVDLISITEPILDEDNALITDALMGAMNEMYSRKLSKNVRRGQEQKVLRGEVCTKPPFGYIRPTPGATFEIVPEEAEIVQYIFEQYKKGRTCYGLATELSKAGVKTRRGNLFDARQVEYIIKNPIYKGYMKITTSGRLHYNRADHPPIIEEAFFDEVQNIYQTRQNRRGEKQMPKERHKHWLSGKIRCGICGGAYSYNRSYGGRNDNFRCTNRMKGKCHESPCITVKNMEHLFLQAIMEMAQSPDQFEVHLVPSSKPIARDFDAEMRKIKSALKRAKDAYLAEIDSIEEYKENKSRLENEMVLLKEEKEKDSLPHEPDMDKFKEKLSNAYTLLLSGADLEQKQSCIEDLIAKVVVNGPGRTITPYFYY